MANTLGSRAWYTYTSDGGTNYAILTDEDLGAAAGLVPATAGLGQLPRRFKPRVLLLQGEDEDGGTIRKQLIVQANNARYAADVGGQVTVDGTPFTVTGRRGEKISFPNFSAVTP